MFEFDVASMLTHTKSLADFFGFWFVLIHEYFDDMAFKRIFCEIIMEPSVESWGSCIYCLTILEFVLDIQGSVYTN